MTTKELLDRISGLPDDTPVFVLETDREGYSSILEVSLCMKPVTKCDVRWRLAGRDDKDDKSALCIAPLDKSFGW